MVAHQYQVLSLALNLRLTFKPSTQAVGTFGTICCHDSFHVRGWLPALDYAGFYRPVLKLLLSCADRCSVVPELAFGRLLLRVIDTGGLESPKETSANTLLPLGCTRFASWIFRCMLDALLRLVCLLCRKTIDEGLQFLTLEAVYAGAGLESDSRGMESLFALLVLVLDLSSDSATRGMLRRRRRSCSSSMHRRAFPNHVYACVLRSHSRAFQPRRSGVMLACACSSSSSSRLVGAQRPPPPKARDCCAVN